VRSVIAPDGSQHTVRIEWIGNRLRRAPADLRRRIRSGWGRDALEFGDGCLDAGDLIAGALFLLAVVLFALVLAPTLFGLFEVLVIVLLAALIWAFRVLFRRPWRVVVTGPAEVREAQCLVVGWRRAHATMVAAAEEVAATGAVRAAFRPGEGVLPPA
jgi:hypothetical protein